VAKCTHPFALVSFSVPGKPLCTKCKRVLPSPSVPISSPPAVLIGTVREFLRLIKASDATIGQTNPRYEMQLVLRMADALHEIDAGEGD
jgi:hypothetical protein